MSHPENDKLKERASELQEALTNHSLRTCKVVNCYQCDLLFEAMQEYYQMKGELCHDD
jgi:hypothetical protein